MKCRECYRSTKQAPFCSQECLALHLAKNRGRIVLRLALCLVLLSMSGCAAFAAAAPVACKVINLANDACMLLTFTGADGAPHTVACSKSELQAWGTHVEKQHQMGMKYVAPTPSAPSSVP